MFPRAQTACSLICSSGEASRAMKAGTAPCSTTWDRTTGWILLSKRLRDMWGPTLHLSRTTISHILIMQLVLLQGLTGSSPAEYAKMFQKQCLWEPTLPQTAELAHHPYPGRSRNGTANLRLWSPLVEGYTPEKAASWRKGEGGFTVVIQEELRFVLL